MKLTQYIIDLITAMNWLDIVLIGSALTSWLAISLTLFCMHRTRYQFRLLQKLYRGLEHELQVVNSASMGMGRRLIDVERKLSSTLSLQLPTEKQSVDQLSYSHAAQLFRSGVQAEEVARSCGLSRAETSLIAMIQQSKNQSVAKNQSVVKNQSVAA